MTLQIKTTHHIEKACWTIAKSFFFIVIIGTMFGALVPTMYRPGNSGARTLIPGTIRAARTETLSAGFPARVVRVECEEGAMVKAGDLIAELESPELLSQIESAGRRLELARLRASLGSRTANSEYSREQATAADRLVESVRRRLDEYSTSEQESAYASARAHAKDVAALVDRQLATSEELETARRSEQNERRNLQMARLTVSRLTEDLEAARSQQRMARLVTSDPDPDTNRINSLEVIHATREYELLKSRLSQLKLVAPFDGVVLGGLATPAETLLAGAPVARIADVSALEVQAQVPASLAMGVTPGTSFDVRLPSDPPLTVKGTLTRSVLAADVRSGGYILRVGIPGGAAYRAFLGVEATVDISH